MSLRLGWPVLGCVSLSMVGTISLQTVAWADGALFVAYPPENHETVADQIFLIGTADPEMEVRVNGQVIENRSSDGHFAPSFPLEIGENTFTLTQGEETLTLMVTRLSTVPPVPEGTNFLADSLYPNVDIARRPEDLICFDAIAPANATVSVQLGQTTLPLMAESQITELPPNYAVLTQTNAPQQIPVSDRYRGCTTGETFLRDRTTSVSNPSASAALPVNLGAPVYQLAINGETTTQSSAGSVELLSLIQFEVAEVTVPQGVARTGPGTDFSRLTPLPQGTRAAVTGRDGEWLRLDYGAWIRASETQVSPSTVPPRSIIRSITSRQIPGWTEVIFPLQTPVPVTVDQSDRTLTLTLHNTTAQTDTIYFSEDPAVLRMDWQPGTTAAPSYTFQFRGDQQWGYKLRYDDTSLILSLKHPPATVTDSLFDINTPLTGLSILLDPGHGSANDLGARGPTGYPEKDVTLIVSKLLRDELEARGATVYLTREGDEDLYPQDRVDMIEQIEPDLALSVHYNALPDNGDALNTAGISTFWYHAQAHDLAAFLHNYLVEQLGRESYGVYWNNLALTRPAVAPSVLLELGFMINPTEFEWITDPDAQAELAATLADGIVAWVETTSVAAQ
ncbi:MAG: N-acetylmuramoyl-L-alanine amidase [Thainema sp.]